jgi:hypothetical protein
MKKFRARLGRLPKGVQALHIDFFGNYNDPNDRGPVLGLFPEEIDYGHLFAYLFRRFGYPNYGWDSYKNLVCYMLTTPTPNLFLRITPYVGSNTELHFQFVTTEEKSRAVRLWEDAPRIDWETRRYDWAESRGLPDWMPDWVAKCDEAVKRDLGGSVKTWRDSIHWAQMYLWHGDEPEQEFPEVTEFLKELDLFGEKRPGCRRHTGPATEWPEDDPLKPLALAAIATLKDLQRPVRVRDCAINMYGFVDDGKRTLDEPDVAGYQAGWLYNEHFKEMADIGDAALKLGGGNLKRGLAKILKMASA